MLTCTSHAKHPSKDIIIIPHFHIPLPYITLSQHFHIYPFLTPFSYTPSSYIPSPYIPYIPSPYTPSLSPLHCLVLATQPHSLTPTLFCLWHHPPLLCCAVSCTVTHPLSHQPSSMPTASSSPLCQLYHSGQHKMAIVDSAINMHLLWEQIFCTGVTGSDWQYTTSGWFD